MIQNQKLLIISKGKDQSQKNKSFI